MLISPVVNVHSNAECDGQLPSRKSEIRNPKFAMVSSDGYFFMSLEFDPIDEVLESLRQGRPIIVTDDANRENEGDLILAAEKATAETVSFMIRYTSGVICVPMEGSDLDRLELPLMTLRNNEAMRTAYTISVDAKSGVTTGISAADRTRTIRLLSDASTRADDLVRPRGRARQARRQ